VKVGVAGDVTVLVAWGVTVCRFASWEVHLGTKREMTETI